MPFVVGTDETDENDIAFLSLKAIDGIYSHQTAIGTQGSVVFQFSTQVLYRCLVGGDKAKVDAFVQNTLAADAFDVFP